MAAVIVITAGEKLTGYTVLGSEPCESYNGLEIHFKKILYALLVLGT
jgi:hypothetical protein